MVLINQVLCFVLNLSCKFVNIKVWIFKRLKEIYHLSVLEKELLYIDLSFCIIYYMVISYVFLQGLEIYHGLSACSSRIEELCTMDISGEDEQELKNCTTALHVFQ